jgi:2-aminoadipate transaminase
MEEVHRAVDDVLALDGPSALQYGRTEGYAPLREWVCGHLAATAGLAVPAEQVLITTGSQQGLDLIGRVLVDPGDVVLVENPAYVGAVQAFRSRGAEVVGLPSDEEGIRADDLSRLLGSTARRPKFLYLVPNFQNPAGTTMSAARRREVAKIAARHGIPVVEDDPYGQLRYSGDPLPSVASSPEAGAWLYLGTSSKILAPGLRVAWMAVPDRRLYDRLVTAKQASDLHTSSFTQRVAARFLSRPGALDGHLARLKRAYALRRDAMQSSLVRHLPPGCGWRRPEGGLFFWVRLPSHVDTVELLGLSARRKVAFVPGAPFWIGEPVTNTLRLNFSNASEDRIAEGVARLGKAAAHLAG